MGWRKICRRSLILPSSRSLDGFPWPIVGIKTPTILFTWLEKATRRLWRTIVSAKQPPLGSRPQEDCSSA